MLTDTTRSPYARAYPLPWDAVSFTGGLWAETAEVCANATVPQLKRMFDDKDISHVVENFKICAGDAQGEHDGTVFGDGDFYKWMEAAVYCGAANQDQELLDGLDEYIDLIGRAQLEDGYISTKQIIGERSGNGIGRMGDINDFEVYNFGHLFTSACLYRRVTGKDNFLRIAVKAADYLEKLYREAAETGQVQTAVCPSHYMGLVEMYRTTGEERYLKLARLAVDLRDSVTEGTDDNQDRTALKKHEKIVGHAVRANYLYAGVADLYAESGDPEYKEVLQRMWKDLMQHKIYITGGCGALYNGVSPYGNFFVDQKIHQAYGYEYQLPNITAYNETCASIGYVMWAYRMFLADPEAEYFDAIERAMLNVNLAAVSLDGKKYFYENMLRRTRELKPELVWELERTEYITSYCCPPNLARLLAQAGEYAYTMWGNTLYTGLYGASRTKVKLKNGAEFTLIQETEYPYDGKIRFYFDKVETDKPVVLKLRIPGWLESGCLTDAAGVRKELSGKEAGTYLEVAVAALKDAIVELTLDMPVRYTAANAMVEEDNHHLAIERGPLVYCMESPDAETETLDDILLSPEGDFQTEDITIEGRGIRALRGRAYRIRRTGYDREALYQTFRYEGLDPVSVRLIPYFAWDNRGFGEMKIWMPFACGNRIGKDV